MLPTSTQLLCLTASSGVPLFSRGPARPSFPVLGSLTGVHMFGAGQGAELLSCVGLGGGRVVWRVFVDSVMLIAVGNREEEELQRLLDNVWGAMVLVLGLDQLTHVRNVERLKKELRCCFFLIDHLLEEDQGEFLGALTHYPDCVVPADRTVLQTAVDASSRTLDSEFCCLLVGGRLAVATERWWSLSALELVLLSTLTRISSGSGSDRPVFLPHSSPSVPLRLLSFTLLTGAMVCALCGPGPALQEARGGLTLCWAPVFQNLREGVSQQSALGPVSVRSELLALVLISRATTRSVSWVTPHPQTLTRRHCWELLRYFYAYCWTRVFSLDLDRPLQTYMTTDECKSYAVHTHTHTLCVIAPPTVPTPTLRAAATHTLTNISTALGL
ncbi:protein fuzzy homolog [Gouania willdenowi]|uniref:protein fuzzy homolog n=1 Tax=Gouania willdenowi TaxID=441366 RepID=UPI00105573E5|nr:protein fuzzy homolog [Gouania willdenowi]